MPHRFATDAHGRRWLPEAAPRQVLCRAAELNWRLWEQRLALGLGGEVGESAGSCWVDSPIEGGPRSIPFPRMIQRNAGIADAVQQRLEGLLASFRERRPDGAVVCWTGPCTRPAELSLSLLARGFYLLQQEPLMVRSLQEPWGRWDTPPGLRVGEQEDPTVWERFSHPFFRSSRSPGLLARQAAWRAGEGWVKHLLAWEGDELIGQASVSMGPGRLGVAGLFDLGVLSEARGRGVGKALTRAACEAARRAGSQWVVLSAAPMGEPMYRRLGFEAVGEVRTWLLPSWGLGHRPEEGARVLAHAAGQGNVVGLKALHRREPQRNLDHRLACGYRPLELAARAGHPEAVRWLMGQGARLDLISARRLGWWPGEAEAYAARCPQLVDLPGGPLGLRPVHVAAAEGDLPLLRWLLEHDADAQARDHWYHATAQDWAERSAQWQAARMIGQHITRRLVPV